MPDVGLALAAMPRGEMKDGMPTSGALNLRSNLEGVVEPQDTKAQRKEIQGIPDGLTTNPR